MSICGYFRKHLRASENSDGNLYRARWSEVKRSTEVEALSLVYVAKVQWMNRAHSEKLFSAGLVLRGLSKITIDRFNIALLFPHALLHHCSVKAFTRSVPKLASQAKDAAASMYSMPFSHSQKKKSSCQTPRHFLFPYCVSLIDQLKWIMSSNTIVLTTELWRAGNQ